MAALLPFRTIPGCTCAWQVRQASVFSLMGSFVWESPRWGMKQVASTTIDMNPTISSCSCLLLCNIFPSFFTGSSLGYSNLDTDGTNEPPRPGNPWLGRPDISPFSMAFISDGMFSFGP